MRERQPCVYILASGFNGTLYVGVTSNLIGRVMQHREGAFRGFTERHDVKRLIWRYLAVDLGLATSPRTGVDAGTRPA